MNEKTIIEFLFNENTERASQKFLFKYIWKKNFTELKKSIIYAVIFLTVGFLPLKGFDKNAVPYIFKYIGFLYIGYIFLLIYLYKYSKKKTDKIIEETIKDFKNSNDQTVRIILKENSFEITNVFNVFGSIWEKTSYKFVGDYLIVQMLEDRLSFIFTKREFNNSDYDILIKYLQKYSKQKK
ncbi:hypothetical protein [Chryseobacterium koreense]|uniref:YcxB-like protein domain-containing protein n=1 Tax=Chryseobacterium koreense CCUG 49689 TaxID=1304281 RepID=A0A0J7IW98_9FLAO|nr:hypothetical protein [Chryseobacterium koreense]KMQ70086.1 hypothetical protein ACM44_14200 [Chryseobacterium koreense CCUG 49689]MBB5334614.1 hypothetical protein [Chryseobacterium koreense]